MLASCSNTNDCYADGCILFCTRLLSSISRFFRLPVSIFCLLSSGFHLSSSVFWFPSFCLPTSIFSSFIYILSVVQLLSPGFHLSSPSFRLSASVFRLLQNGSPWMRNVAAFFTLASIFVKHLEHLHP